MREACAGDESLLRMVREMVDADRDPEAKEQIANMIGGAASMVADEDARSMPARIGAYELKGEIGSGGMGRVYLATRADDQYQKQVAIKVVRTSLAYPASRERFLQERQILATLDHPFIARLLDGGTTADGRPYLILDYIEGEIITRYCAEAKLSIQDRCRLFIRVCEAVTYAHQNLIVHRDLKPANILVTRDGVPKLLDFGIAKLVGDDGKRDATTRAAYGLMTPQYASPEQVRGQAATKATDVYSLGAIFYELLSGSAAHRFETYSATELVRVICEQDVEPPSRRADERIPRDLDNIVLKALAKDPRRRYASAEQLAEDIRRHLNRLPVLARGNSAMYQLGRFVQRQWMPLAAAAAIVATLSFALAASRSQARLAENLRQAAVRERDRAEVERRRAESAARDALAQRAAALASSREANEQRGRADRRFEQVRNLIQRFLFDIDTAVADLPGTSAARRVVAKTALEYLDGMVSEPGLHPGLQRELAVAYERVGELQGSPTKPSLGDLTGALRSYQKALAIRLRLPHDSVQARTELIGLYTNMAVAQKILTSYEDSVKVYDAALKLYQPGDPAMDFAIADIYYQRGSLRENNAFTKEALEDFRAAWQIFEKRAAADEQSARARNGKALARYQIGALECRMGNYAGGLADLRQSVGEMTELTRLDPSNVHRKRYLAVFLRAYGNNVGDRQAGAHRDLAQSLAHMKRALEVNKQLADADPANQVARRDYIRAIGSAARVHSLGDEWEPGVKTLRQALDLMEEVRKQAPDDRQVLGDCGYYLLELATAETYLKQYTPASKHFRDGIAIFERLLALGSKSRFHHFNIALATRKLGDIAAAQGDTAQARTRYARALQVFNRLIQEDSKTTMFPWQRDETVKAIAELEKGK